MRKGRDRGKKKNGKKKKKNDRPNADRWNAARSRQNWRLPQKWRCPLKLDNFKNGYIHKYYYNLKKELDHKNQVNPKIEVYIAVIHTTLSISILAVSFLMHLPFIWWKLAILEDDI